MQVLYSVQRHMAVAPLRGKIGGRGAASQHHTCGGLEGTRAVVRNKITLFTTRVEIS